MQKCSLTMSVFVVNLLFIEQQSKNSFLDLQSLLRFFYTSPLLTLFSNKEVQGRLKKKKFFTHILQSLLKRQVLNSAIR
jgi:hypothetical protein